ELVLATSQSADGQIDLIGSVQPKIHPGNIALVPDQTVGNTVFDDKNNNGVRDFDEPGIPNVVLSLIEDTDSDGFYNQAIDLVLETTTTNPNGQYSFDELPPGSYFISVDSENFFAGAELFSKQSSLGTNTAPMADNGVDDDDNGTPTTSGAIITSNFRLPLGNSNTNPTIDFGIASIVDVSVEVADMPDPVQIGNQLTYQIDVNNAGPSIAANSQLVHELPPGVSLVSVRTDKGTIVQGTRNLTVDLGNLGIDETVQLDIVVEVLSDAANPLNAIAMVTSDGFDVNLANNEDTEQTNLVNRADLRIAKTDSVDPVVPGMPLTYTLTVTNEGPTEAENVTITDALPNGLNNARVTTTHGTASANGSSINASLGTLNVGQSAVITIITDVDPSLTTNLLNTATVSSTTEDPVPNNNIAEEPTAVTPNGDLAVTKSDNPDPVTPGNQLNYTIVVTNDGPSVSRNVRMLDSLPIGTTFDFASSTKGSVVNNGNELTASVGDLAVGESATIDVTVRIDEDVLGTISNTARVESDTPDNDLSNNEDTENTATAPNADLGITKIDSI
ncbi:MAG: SdrD B-like domain-containing protein, partial [Planctomycetota bacterium]